MQLTYPTVTQNDIIVTNVRHYEALTKALEAIHRVQDGLDSQISGDFLSQDIRECIFFISDIVGEVTNDMVLQNIFQHFCDYQRLAYIINDYQGVHFERLSF